MKTFNHLNGGKNNSKQNLLSQPFDFIDSFDSETDSTLIYRNPEDTIDGQRIEEEYKNKEIKKIINHAEYQRRLLFMEKEWNDEKEFILREIQHIIIQWGMNNKVYIKDLLKEISKIN